MILALEKIENYAVEAMDGYLGRISDFLFDDKNWNVKWIVVDPSWSSAIWSWIRATGCGARMC